MRTIKDKIIKSEHVDWKKFEFIQSKNFKELTKPAYEKLKQSIIKNNFVESFKVWQNGKKMYCLDGYHRCLILKELEADGWDVPLKFRADFIDCKDKKEAAKLVTIYSSIYADVKRDGLDELLKVEGLDPIELDAMVNIPGLSLTGDGFYSDEESIIFEKSVQLEPPKEYILIMAEPNSEEWDDLKNVLKLKMVRRGGYRKGSPFDQHGLERVIMWEELKRRMDADRSTK